MLATSREAYGPALEGDVVAWVDHEEGSEPRIVTFDLKSGEKREIARTHVAEFYNNFMQIADGKLLWSDIYDGTGHYVVHDLATATTRDYPMPATRFRYPGYAWMSGDAVYSINFDRYDQWDWGTQQVGRYSLATREFTPITKGGEFVNAPRRWPRRGRDHRLRTAAACRTIRRHPAGNGPERRVGDPGRRGAGLFRRRHGGRGSL